MAEPSPNVTAIRADIGKPTAVHEKLWNQITAHVQEMMGQYLPRMGTVIDNSDGHVTVTMDDEADDRTVHLPRHKGTRHIPGDRVLVQRLQGGDEVISPGVSSKQGQDPAVDRNQIFDAAIQRRHIDSNAVGPNELAHSTVQRTHLAPEVSGDITDARAQGITGQTLAGNAQSTANTAVTNASSAQNAADDARYRLIGTHGYGDGAEGRITAAKNRADAAFSSADAANTGLGNILNNDIPALKSRLTALEKYNVQHP